MENQEIQQAMNQARVYRWEVAKKLGISEPTFYRWMRTPLDEKRRSEILQAIQTIINERKG